ncbi:putative Zf-FLZ domain-containing protein [Helianthus annuus]|uniref:Zf-FLZ domain-containing protein n=2 Tax=Helianthus annuus TaxID=4232 RepID=A0A9K3GSU4_HELAN|nr:FCS-Like Zinc finger 10 [Helianthus annuus]XP_022021022.1 FCS-Like Zinc finger 10 [Helianthus annuus]KAF5754031.1 putative Zf-FLZ domain-containing protein [Helianthus annuus]KAJ0428004.1 putative Zf-FLZ domain, FCS-Like Zinc finger [Helianthus annuus]KAJ0431979.1 putative Zf-FLZ domain-containing protein [Helianthus annuus]KAJ0635148.1 putative Zf-FLZ domain, FCS-Like Zinc finger [Helianthus annuus]KAJ0824896.1 putative Zf-FLZ domain-containing protein [Helianthus annuus]
MLRKRTRSHQKDQQNMGHAHNTIPESYSNESCYSNSDAFLKPKHKTNSFFTVPGLFVGLNPKNSESDSVRSPTSPLDFKVFSKPNFANLPIRASSTKPNESAQKSWDCNKVGLSIIEALDDETKPSSGKILRSSDSKSILFGPQMRILNNPSLKPASFDPSDSFSYSLPKNYAVFSNSNINKSNPKLINHLVQEPFTKFWSHSLDSANFGPNSTHLTTRPTNLNPGKDLVASLSASEIELSEDYTCVRKHGPNPKTTHIFGDCILERHEDEFIAKSLTCEEHAIKPAEVENSYLPDNFLSFCYSCKKKLEGEDIYMYRGEKAFCSWNCRAEEILIEEEMEKNTEAGSSSQTEITQKPDGCEELYETSMFIAA